jgi:hypothetical protein
MYGRRQEGGSTIDSAAVSLISDPVTLTAP